MTILSSGFLLSLASSLLYIVDVCTASPATFREIATIKRSASDIAESYDYVIVGGGTSGLTVADRLTEDGTKTVLVLEYGLLGDDDITILTPPWDHNVWAHVSSSRFYNITSVPQPGLAGRTPALFGGAIVGGGSAVNGMFFDRGSREDYDNWAELGNPGWDFEGLLPYFKKAITGTPPDKELQEAFNITWDADSYGDGPIQASFAPWVWPGQKNQWDAFLELGASASTKPAGGEAYGMMWIPSSQDPVTRYRSFAGPGYYEQDKTRVNYHLLVGQKVLAVNFSANLSAEGVSFQARNGTGEVVYVNATTEVILAAGFQSSQILQRSGVGPKDLLAEAGIEVLVDLPGVGQNFHDHAYGFLGLSYENNVAPNSEMLATNATFLAEAEELWANNRTGPLSTIGYSAAFLPLQTVTSNWSSIIASAESQDPSTYLTSQYTGTLLDGHNAQRAILFERYASNKSAILETTTQGQASALYLNLKPFSRGSININTSNPFGDPVVDFQTLTNPVNVEVMISMIKCLKLWLTIPANQALGALEGSTTANATDAQLETLLRSTVSASFVHPVGTSSMLPLELGGVVGSDLLVYGVHGLSVVDASIIPLIPGTHLSATVYAIAEKAADLIKGRYI